MNAKRLLSAIVAFVFAISMVGTMQLSAFATGDALASLDWSDIANGQIKSFVTKDLSLPTTLDGATVSWTSSKETVISTAGKVARTMSDESVTLTAASGDATKSFNVIVASIMSGNVKASYSFDDQTAGTSVRSAYSNFNSTLNANDNVSEYVVIEDSIEAGNHVMSPDISVGYKTYTAAQKEELLKSTNVVEHTYSGKTYTYYLEDEIKTDSTGATYCNGIFAIDGTVQSYYIGLYVNYDEATGKCSVNTSKYKLANNNWIYDDGRPFTNIADGKPNAALLSVSAPDSLGTLSGGEATMSFRFAWNSDVSEVRTKTVNIYTSLDGNSSRATWSGGGLTWGRFPVKFNDTTSVTVSAQTKLIGKTADSAGIYDNTSKINTLAQWTYPGQWMDVKVQYDYDNKVGRLYVNGLPVFWAVTSGGVTKYSSELDISALTTFPSLDLYSDRFYQYLDCDVMIDDLSWSYISKEEKEELLCPSWSEIANDQLQSFVTSDLALSNATEGTVWTSSNETVISTTGKVTRALDTKYVTLTATIGDIEKSFDVVVPSKLEAASAVGSSFDALSVGAGTDGITGFAEGSTSATRGVHYTVSQDTADSSNKVLYFDSKIGDKILSADEQSYLISLNRTYTGTDGATYHVYETEPRTDANGKRYFTGMRSNRKPYCSAIYVVEQDGKWVADTSMTNWYRYFNEDGSIAANSTSAPAGNQLTVSAPAGAAVNDGLYSMSFRFAEPETNVDTSGYGSLGIQTGSTTIFGFGRTSISSNKDMRPDFVYDDETVQGADAVSTDTYYTKKIGKTADLTGNVSSADASTKLMDIPEREFGEWVEIEIKYDFNADTARMYYNGKPVYWAVTVGGVTKYCSDMVIADASVPAIKFSSVTALNNEFFVDDVKTTYTSSLQQANILVNELDYVKAPVVETELVLGDSAKVSYSASKLAVDELTAAVNSTIGFGSEADVITATATVNGKTATKDHEIIIKKRVPYAVNSVVLTKDGVQVYTPCAGAVLEKLTFDVNSAKTGASVYIAKYDAEGNLAGIATRSISASGEALVNITLAEGETYKVFTFDGGLVPCNLPEDFAQTQKENVKLFVIGDGDAKSFGAKLADSFTENVTVDNSQALIGATAKTALSGGSLDYVLEEGTAGDYVLISLGGNDATTAQYTALISQMVKAVENAGMTAVLVTPAEASDYTTAMKAVGTKYGVLCVDASTLADPTSQAVATYIATQVKSALLTISAYVK